MRQGCTAGCHTHTHPRSDRIRTPATRLSILGGQDERKFNPGREDSIPGDDNISYPQYVIPPSSSITIEQRDAHPVLFSASGQPLTRDRRIGFRHVR